MENHKDVDEVLLAKANSLVTYVRLNADDNALRNTRILCLADVPEFLISLFELITEQPLSDEQRTFRTLYERSTTLQSIIDCLEKWQNLPLSHINGAGITRLDRRQLNDAIQIFSDIIKHLFPPKPDPQQQRAPEPATEPGVHASDIDPGVDPRLQTNRPLTLDHLRTSHVRSHSGASSSNREQHLVPTRDISPVVPPKQQYHSAHQGMLHRDPSLDISETLPKSVPAKASGEKSASLSRKPSISRPSVYPVTRKKSVRGSTSSRTSVTSSKDPVTSGRAKPVIVPIRRISTSSRSSRGLTARSAISPIERPRSFRGTSTRSAVSPIARSTTCRCTVDRNPSVRSIKPSNKVVPMSKPSISDNRTVIRGVRKNSFKAKPIAALRLARDKSGPVATTTKQRRPSVVSSKVRKHSTGHGTFSPRTISLASFIKLQQELEYHIERLGDIEKEMETHIDALRCLQEEKVGLLAVVRHVKSSVSNLPAVRIARA